jgi:hypothetical protein
VRLALAALLLGLVCAVHAQTEKKAPFKAESTRSERERDRHREHKPAKASEQRAPMATKTEKKAPFKAEPPRSERERERDRDRRHDRERHREPKPLPSAREQTGTMNLPPKPPAKQQFSVHPSETRPRPTAPSPAEQFQREQQQQRRVEQGRSGGTQQQAVFQCSARPSCAGGYGRCSSVQQTYRGGSEASRRAEIVDECIQANTPDTCQCAVQCRRVARCSNF